MRNPIRVKNLRLRFAPLYLAGLVLLVFVRPGAGDYALGTLAVVAGEGLRTWGAGHLVKTTSLTVTGPYAHLRHPLYLGTLLVGCGVGVMLSGWWMLGVLALFLPWFFLDYFPRKERSESARLQELYGEAFAQYRAAVPALVPRLAAWNPTPAAARLFDSSRRWSLERYSQNNELGTMVGLVVLVAAFGVRTAIVLGGQ
jgi:protein-S-isoprenylcysteine O-methyltransferase Ste14